MKDTNGGNFFAIDRHQWEGVCELGMNPALLYLVLARGSHFNQGFEYFARPEKPQNAGEVVDAALEYLTSRRGLPTLLYLHTMDPHWPYTPPAPFDRRYPPAPAPGRAAAAADALHRRPRAADPPRGLPRADRGAGRAVGQAPRPRVDQPR